MEIITLVIPMTYTNCYIVISDNKKDAIIIDPASNYEEIRDTVLKKGVKVSGATVHIVTPECDAGPIILQKAVSVLEGDTPEVLQKRIMEEAEWKILPEAVRLFCDGKIEVRDNKVFIK